MKHYIHPAVVDDQLCIMDQNSWRRGMSGRMEPRPGTMRLGVIEGWGFCDGWIFEQHPKTREPVLELVEPMIAFRHSFDRALELSREVHKSAVEERNRAAEAVKAAQKAKKDAEFANSLVNLRSAKLGPKMRAVLKAMGQLDADTEANADTLRRIDTMNNTLTFIASSVSDELIERSATRCWMR